MPRFAVGARVRAKEEKNTARLGTIIEVLVKTSRAGGFDRYRVEFSERDIKVLSDLELAPAESATAEQDIA